MSFSSLQYDKLKEILEQLEANGALASDTKDLILNMIQSDAMKSTSLAPEFLTISATTSASASSFSNYTPETIQEVTIQNLDDSNDVYVNFSATEEPAVTTSGICIPAGAALSLVDTDYIYFAAVTESGTATVRIAGLG